MKRIKSKNKQKAITRKLTPKGKEALGKYLDKVGVK